MTKTFITVEPVDKHLGPAMEIRVASDDGSIDDCYPKISCSVDNKDYSRGLTTCAQFGRALLLLEYEHSKQGHKMMKHVRKCQI